MQRWNKLERHHNWGPCTTEGLGYVQTEPRQQLESAEALDGCAGGQVGALQAQQERGVAGAIVVRIRG